MDLIPVSFTEKQLYKASKDGMKLFVSCRGEFVIWSESYLDLIPHDEQDVCIRDDLFGFGDDFGYDLGEIAEEGFKSEDGSFTFTEHFPECRKDELFAALDLLDNFKPATLDFLSPYECPLFAYLDRYDAMPVSWKDVDWDNVSTLKEFVSALSEWIEKVIEEQVNVPITVEETEEEEGYY